LEIVTGTTPWIADAGDATHETPSRSTVAGTAASPKKTTCPAPPTKFSPTM